MTSGTLGTWRRGPLLQRSKQALARPPNEVGGACSRRLGYTRAVLIGRERELDLLGGALAGLASRQGRLLLLAGEAGIGKTSLVDAIAKRAAAGGQPVLWGRCWEAGGAPPFWPWTQVLRAARDVAVDGERAEVERVLGRLLSGAAPDGPSPDSEPVQARFRLFDEVAGLLRRLAERTPLLIALDDLHAADQSSLLLLRFVARGALHDLPLLLLGTYRDAEARVGDAGGLLSQIAREGDRVPLGRRAPSR